MKEIIKKLLIGTFILGSFSTQATRAGAQKAAKLKTKELQTVSPIGKHKIEQFMRRKTNLSAEEKTVVVAAIQILHKSEQPSFYTKMAEFVIIDDLVNPYHGTIYAVKWTTGGTHENTIIRFLQEFVNQSEVHSLERAFNETLLKTGWGNPSNLSQKKTLMMYQPLWFLNSDKINFMKNKNSERNN